MKLMWLRVGILFMTTTAIAAQVKTSPPKGPLGPFPIPPIGPKAMPVPKAGEKEKPAEAPKPKPGADKPATKPGDPKSAKPLVAPGPFMAKQSQMAAGTLVTLEGCLVVETEKASKRYVIVSSPEADAPRFALEGSGDLASHVNQRVKLVGTSKATSAAEGQPSATIVKVDKLEVVASDCNTK